MTPYDLEDYSQLARTYKAMTALIVSLKILSHYVSSNLIIYWSEYFVLRQMKMLDVLFDIGIIMDSEIYILCIIQNISSKLFIAIFTFEGYSKF